LHFEKSGPEVSKEILLLHGWGSSAELMRPLAGMLDNRFLVVNVDLPGHGHTPPPSTPYGVPDYAREVATLIKTEMNPPVTIVGHSNGGRIALFMASNDEYRDLISSLILISPSGMTPSISAKTRVKRLVAVGLKAPFTILPGTLRESGLEWLRGTALWRSLGSSDYRALSGVMRETFVRTVTMHLDDDVQRISVPTLVFWGTDDHDVKRDQIDRLVNRISDAGLVALEGAGHYGYLDNPSTVKAGILHFLDHV
jgi:pimeloyl-ACP methyl ester carboxylesterase